MNRIAKDLNDSKFYIARIFQEKQGVQHTRPQIDPGGTKTLQTSNNIV